jgi:DNA-binding transcriptional regulator YiaG
MKVVEHNSPATLAEYKAENLGAPFDVVLIESVREYSNPLTGESEVQIPNLRGLLQEAAICRSLHPRRFSGEDITFIRKAIPLKAKELANLLDVSPEHLSRCESGDRLLSSSCERHLRLLTVFKSKKTCGIIDQLASEKSKTKKGQPNLISKNAVKILKDIQNIVLSMKIVSVYEADSRLSFSFRLDDGAVAVSRLNFKDLVGSTNEIEESWKPARAA